MEWKQVKSCAVENGSLVIKASNAAVDEVMAESLKDYRQVILDYLKSCDPETDYEKFEGGIDDWWGPGSVLIFELGHDVVVRYSMEGTTVTVE